MTSLLFPADLHIHTALSPCAEREMDPPRVFARARAAGLRVIAITDHNSTANLPAFLASPPKDLWVIPGMEVQTKEEVHMVCLFPGLEEAMDWGELVKKHLPPVNNRPEFFGEQTVVDAEGNSIGQEEILLLNSVSLSLEEVVKLVTERNGLVYPAHCRRPSFSIYSQLGVVPSCLPKKVLEISPGDNRAVLEKEYPGYRFICSSDAHRLAEIGWGRTIFPFAGARWSELVRWMDLSIYNY
jgi:PHP family Zn ribbon phosphoesterase